MNIVLFLVALAAVWNIAPFVVLSTLPMPIASKWRAAASLLGAVGKGFLVLLPDLAAPLVVPFTLLGVKREAEHLPTWARWWDNDVSINGDQAEGAETYYAPGHDRRSFWARYMWLGWRNRASWLSQCLGHTWAPGEYEDAQHWGDPLVGRDHEGWTVNRRATVYQLYVVKRFGPLCFRMNFGHKVWAGEGDKREVANVVNIAFSLLRWRGTM